MAYHFDPQRTRRVLEGIRARFPLQHGGEPLGLAQLFNRLEQMHPDTAARWGEQLTQDEIDLLCRYFHRSPRPAVALSISAVLGHRADPRCTQVVHYFLLLCPNEGELERFSGYWSRSGKAELIAGKLPWAGRLLRQEPVPPVDVFVKKELLQERLSLDILEARFSRDTPLFTRLTGFLFTEGARLLAGLQSDIANERVCHYLEQGDFQCVRNFIIHYPEELWSPEFLHNLYRSQGPLNEHRSEFYRALEKGSLWKVRQTMFRPRMESFTSDRLEFWQRWVHRVSEWRWIQGIAHIYLHPLKVVEEPERSLIFLETSERFDPIEIIDRDPFWEEKMEEVLGEYTRWD